MKIMRGEHVFYKEEVSLTKVHSFSEEQNRIEFVVEQIEFPMDFPKFSTVRFEEHGIFFQGNTWHLLY